MNLLALSAFILMPVFSQSITCDTLDKCQELLRNDGRSSLVHYRLGSIYFLQGSYQKAVNEYREAMAGDLKPGWVQVWSHINLGKIFDVTNQRDRALNEYRMAVATKDNTQGALDEAAKYIEAPYN
jgi:tetratricopeptide (TPR) repeat protein